MPQCAVCPYHERVSAGGWSGCAAADDPHCAFREFPFVDLALEGGCAGGAEGELAESVGAGVALEDRVPGDGSPSVMAVTSAVVP